MPRRKKPKPVRYATVPEEVSAPEPKKRRAKRRAKKAAKKSKKAAPKATRKPEPAPAKKSSRKRAKPKAKQGKARSARRSNPAPQIEASFYQLGTLMEFEFEEAGVPRRFAFDQPPLLAADAAGKLRIVYDPAAVPGARVPRRISELHETFSGYAPERNVTGVFGKRVPGTRVLGVLRALTYFSEKCVDAESCSSPGRYRHAFEAPFPRVLTNPAGLVLIEGGSYQITRAGIVH